MSVLCDLYSNKLCQFVNVYIVKMVVVVVLILNKAYTCPKMVSVV